MYWMTFPWHLPKVMSVALINKKSLICTIKRESLTRSLQNVVSVPRKWCLLPDHIFVKFWWKRLFWRFVPQNFGCIFSRSKTTWAISQKWLVQLTWKEVEVHLLDAGETIWHWPLTWSVNLTFDFSRSNFEIAVSYKLLTWLMSNGKEVNQFNKRLTIWPFLWQHLWPWPWSFKVKVRNILILGKGAPIDMIQKGQIHPLMTMTLTFVWPCLRGWIYRVVTRVSLDGVPATYVVFDSETGIILNFSLFYQYNVHVN